MGLRPNSLFAGPIGGTGTFLHCPTCADAGATLISSIVKSIPGLNPSHFFKKGDDSLRDILLKQKNYSKV